MSFVLLGELNGCYTFSSRPRAVETRSGYREAPSEQTKINYGNIMFDRRVVRGNTYSRHVNQTTVEPDPTKLQRQQEIRRRAIARKKAREQVKPRKSEALRGRKHIDLQTDLYMDELSDVTVASDADCQTDDFQDRPTTPLFIPVKSGIDAETRLEDGELFDFDVEVQELLEVLGGKIIQQSLEEVMKEEELACLKAQQRAFRELRNREQAEVQRLQEQERCHNEEKERRVLQQKEALQTERETAEKIAALAYTQQYLADLFPAVFTSLRTQGHLYDPVERDIELNFFPWLMEEINNGQDRKFTTRELLDTIIIQETQSSEAPKSDT